MVLDPHQATTLNLDVALPTDIPGEVFHVNNSAVGVDGSAVASNNNLGTQRRLPLSTIQGGLDRCVASRGDMILVYPGHIETVIVAAGLDLDIAGVTIRGLGNGTLQPTINFTTATTADMDIDAANITIENMAFDLTGIDALVAPIDVNSAGFKMSGCRVIMADSGGQSVLGILTDAAADRMIIEDCIFEASTDAGAAAAIRLVGCDRPIIRNCKFYGDYSVGNISFLTTAVTNVWIEHNDFDNLNAVDVNIEGLAASTGSVRLNTCRVATDTQTTWMNTMGAMQLFENYGVNNDAEAGILIGTPSV